MCVCLFATVQWCHLETGVIKFAFTFPVSLNIKVKKEGKYICAVLSSASLSAFTDIFVRLVSFTFSELYSVFGEEVATIFEKAEDFERKHEPAQLLQQRVIKS